MFFDTTQSFMRKFFGPLFKFSWVYRFLNGQRGKFSEKSLLIRALVFWKSFDKSKKHDRSDKHLNKRTFLGLSEQEHFDFCNIANWHEGKISRNAQIMAEEIYTNQRSDALGRKLESEMYDANL